MESSETKAEGKGGNIKVDWTEKILAYLLSLRD